MNFIRKHILFLSLLIPVFIRPAIAQEPNKDKFYQGVTYFTAGSYEEALQVWNEIYKTGFRSANLDYNIGNAYFKLNNIPSAILFYERAYLLNPADENINYNLQVARTLIVDRFQEIPELFFVKWYNFVSLFLFLSLSTLAFTVRNKSLVYDSRKAIVTSSLVNGKSSPDKSGTDLFVLHEGTKVTIEDTVGEWFEIRLSDGNKGWVPGNSLVII